MNGTDVALAAALAGTASEAAGITDVTPIGRTDEQDRSGGSGPASGINIIPEQAPPDLSGLVQAVAGMGGGPTVIQPGSPQKVPTAQQIADALSGQGDDDGGSDEKDESGPTFDLTEWMEERRQDWEDATSGDDDRQERDERSTDDDGDEWTIREDYNGPGSDVVRAGATVADETADVPGDVTGFFSKTGNTLGQAWKATQGEVYDTENTFADFDDDDEPNKMQWQKSLGEGISGRLNKAKDALSGLSDGNPSTLGERMDRSQKNRSASDESGSTSSTSKDDKPENKPFAGLPVEDGSPVDKVRETVSGGVTGDEDTNAVDRLKEWRWTGL